MIRERLYNDESSKRKLRKEGCGMFKKNKATPDKMHTTFAMK